MNKFIRAIAAFAFSLNTFAAGGGLVTKARKHSVAETLGSPGQAGDGQGFHD